MAELIEIGHSEAKEKVALQQLATLLPSDYRLTTSVRIEDRQLDSVLLSPYDIVCLELKHWPGDTTPKTNGRWERGTSNDFGDGDSGPNPFEQARIGSQKLRSSLRRRITSGLPVSCYVDFLVVFSHPDAKLRLSGDGLEPRDRYRVRLLTDVPHELEKSAKHFSKPRILGPEAHQSIIDLLKNPGKRIEKLPTLADGKVDEQKEPFEVKKQPEKKPETGGSSDELKRVKFRARISEVKKRWRALTRPMRWGSAAAGLFVLGILAYTLVSPLVLPHGKGPGTVVSPPGPSTTPVSTNPAPPLPPPPPVLIKDSTLVIVTYAQGDKNALNTEAETTTINVLLKNNLVVVEMPVVTEKTQGTNIIQNVADGNQQTITEASSTFNSRFVVVGKASTEYLGEEEQLQSVRAELDIRVFESKTRKYIAAKVFTTAQVDITQEAAVSKALIALGEEAGKYLAEELKKYLQRP